MADPSRKNKELIEENFILKQRIQELEQPESDPKRAEEAMLDIKTRHRMLFEHHPDGIVIINPATGRFLEFNETAHRQLGYSRKEFAQLSISDLDASETPDETRSHIQKVISERWSDFDTIHRTRQGGIRNIHVTEQYTEILGRPIYHCIWRDITDRKRTEDETAILVEIGRVIASTLQIEEVYERFAVEVRKLIPFDRIHVNLQSPDGQTLTIAYVSGFDIAGRRAGDQVPIAGTMTESLFRTRIGMFFHPMSEEDILSRFPDASATTTFRAGMHSILAVPLISRDQVIGALHFRAKKPNAFTEQDLRLAERIGRQIAGAIANAQIFSNLTKAERELRESEEKHRILFNNDLTVIYIYELETLRLLDVNHAFVRLYGYNREELLGGMRLLDISAEPEESASSVRNAFEKNAIFIPLRWHRKKDGTVFPVEIVGGGYVWKGRRVMYGMAKDITERRQAEKTLIETLNQLESRVQERTIELEETNTALRVLLKKGAEDLKRLEESLQSNINQLVTPFLSKLKVSQSNQERLTYLNILEANLNNIVSPFINRLSAAYKNLTPKEIQIAELIKQGKRSKEIAELFGITVGTVISHRNHIRKKLDLKSQGANLRSYLLSLV